METDGIDHINIYSKGKTEVGRWLSNFAYSPIKTEHGDFDSIEGYWYWLTTLHGKLRTLYGFAAKKLGKDCKKVREISDKEFKEYICKALDAKLKTDPRWVAESVNLPLKHYYEYGGKRVEKQEYNWIVEHIQTRVKQLKEYYDNRGGN